MTDDTGGEKNLKTILNAIKVIEAIEDLGGASLTELASHLNMATSTIHGYLNTLENAHYITKADDEYQLSLIFYKHGMHAKRSIGIIEISTPLLDKIAEKTGETVWLVVEEHGKSVLLEQATGENAVPMEADIGDRVDIHSVAGGKAILAYQDEKYVQEVIDLHGLTPRTEHTITDEETFRKELEQVREQGFAVNQQESVLGLRSISVPIRRDDEVIAAISIAGPAHRLTDSRINEEISSILLEASNEIELKMQYT